MGGIFGKEPKCTHEGSFYDLRSKDIDGGDVSFERFQGKVAMITNVASK